MMMVLKAGSACNIWVESLSASNGQYFDLELGLYSDYSVINSSVMIVTNKAALKASHL